METITVEQVCDWIKSSPYTDIISNLTDVTPEEIIDDFLDYISKSEKI